MARTKLEREVVIVFNEAEPDAVITVTSPVWKRRLERKGYIFKALAPNSESWRTFAPKARVAPKTFSQKRTANAGGFGRKQAITQPSKEPEALSERIFRRGSE